MCVWSREVTQFGRRPWLKPSPPSVDSQLLLKGSFSPARRGAAEGIRAAEAAGREQGGAAPKYIVMC